MITSVRNAKEKIFVWTALLAGVVVALLKGLQPVAWLGIGSPLVLVGGVLTLYFVVLACGKVRFDRVLLSFVMVAFLSLILSPPEAGFRAWERLGFFTLMVGLLSPMIENEVLRRLRPLMWEGMMWGFRVVVALSLIGFISLCFGCRLLNNGYWMSFSGVTAGGMLLAPVTAVVLIDLGWRLLSRSVRHWSFWVLLIVGIAIGAMMLQAASRIATVGTILAFLIMLWFRRGRLRNIRRRPLLASLLGAIIMTTGVVIIPRVSDTVIFKFQIGTRHSSLTYSRDAKWEGRLEEFRSSPVFGIGFATQKVFSQQFDNETHSRMTGLVEPGSSWLSVLAQTGIAGFILLLVFNIRLVSEMLRMRNSISDIPWMLAMLIFLIVNGIAEGWILYAGSTMFFTYWSLTGLLHNKKNYCSEKFTIASLTDR